MSCRRASPFSSAEIIEQAAVQHFEELVNIVPNLNWSGDGHRARYFQIRGIGELEQYQGAPNPSVGFLIDDIDFSGIGTIATLFELDRSRFCAVRRAVAMAPMHWAV